MPFRRYQPADLQQCLEIYELNRPGRFPDKMEPSYARVLEEQTSYTLVAERDGRIVATGGIEYWGRKNVSTLSFGLVHPAFQGKGIGAALVLSRLALLNTYAPIHHVFIFAVRKSFGYYRRLGFRPFNPWKDVDGNEHPSGLLVVLQRDVLNCRKLLAAHQISFPPGEDNVPLQEHSKPTSQTSPAT